MSARLRARWGIGAAKDREGSSLLSPQLGARGSARDGGWRAPNRRKSGSVLPSRSGSSLDSTEVLSVRRAGLLPRRFGYPARGSLSSRTQDTSSTSFPAIPCSFSLETTPPDLEKVFVRANDDLLELNADDGFRYDEGENAIYLQGQACDDLRFGITKRLGVSYGCAPSACVPSLEICNGLDDDCDDLVDENVCGIR